MRVRVTLAGAALVLAALAASCSNSSGPPNTPAGTPASEVSARAAASTGREATGTPGASATLAVTPAEPGSQERLTGIVGTVSPATKTIQVTRLSGAPVQQIRVVSTTVIRTAGGARIDLGGVRTSDRIIADGRLDDRGEALIADDITVSPAVPGAAPGG
ncbi:MAG: hypothetical protein IVW36_04535 [Dehalococcoidia bacterium]|nr:hypothetical protein [Dehalococcoidia bacterium]